MNLIETMVSLNEYSEILDPIAKRMSTMMIRYGIILIIITIVMIVIYSVVKNNKKEKVKDTGYKEWETVLDNASKPLCLYLSHGRIEGKGDQCHSHIDKAFCCVARSYMEWIGYKEQSNGRDKKHQCFLAGKFIVDQKMGKHHGENRIAGDHDGSGMGIQVYNSNLEEGHAEGYSHCSQKSHITPVRGCKGKITLLKFLDGQRKKDDAAYKEAEEVHLESSKGMFPHLEGNLHGSET